MFYECKMNFKMGSLRCVKYVEKKSTYYYAVPTPILGDNIQSQILKRDQKK